MTRKTATVLKHWDISEMSSEFAPAHPKVDVLVDPPLPDWNICLDEGEEEKFFSHVFVSGSVVHGGIFRGPKCFIFPYKNGYPGEPTMLEIPGSTRGHADWRRCLEDLGYEIING